jgi:hypothetical protein
MSWRNEIPKETRDLDSMDLLRAQDHRVRSRDSCFTITSTDLSQTPEAKLTFERRPDPWISVAQSVLHPMHKAVQYICVYIRQVDGKYQLRGYCFLAQDVQRSMNSFRNYIVATHEKPDVLTRKQFANGDPSFPDMTCGPFRVGIPPHPGRRSDIGKQQSAYFNVPRVTISQTKMRVNVLLPTKDTPRIAVLDVLRDDVVLQTKTGAPVPLVFILNGNNWAHYNEEKVVICMNPETCAVNWHDFADGVSMYVPYFRKRILSHIETVWIVLNSNDTKKCNLPDRYNTYKIEHGRQGYLLLRDYDYYPDFGR